MMAHTRHSDSNVQTTRTPEDSRCQRVGPVEDDGRCFLVGKRWARPRSYRELCAGRQSDMFATRPTRYVCCVHWNANVCSCCRCRWRRTVPGQGFAGKVRNIYRNSIRRCGSSVLFGGFFFSFVEGCFRAKIDFSNIPFSVSRKVLHFKGIAISGRCVYVTMEILREIATIAIAGNSNVSDLQ